MIWNCIGLGRIFWEYCACLLRQSSVYLKLHNCSEFQYALVIWMTVMDFQKECYLTQVESKWMSYSSFGWARHQIPKLFERCRLSFCTYLPMDIPVYRLSGTPFRIQSNSFELKIDERAHRVITINRKFYCAAVRRVRRPLPTMHCVTASECRLFSWQNFYPSPPAHTQIQLLCNKTWQKWLNKIRLNEETLLWKQALVSRAKEIG